MQTQLIRTPVSTLLSPNVPVPQTSSGTMDDATLFNTVNIDLAGQPPNQDFHLAREEFLQIFPWDGTAAVGATLACIDVARFCGDDQNDPELVGPRSTQSRVLPQGRVIFPRILYIKGMTYTNLTVKVSFWIHKPQGPVVGGKLRISYYPGIRKNWPDTKLRTGDLSGDVDTLYRENMWEWDVKASNTHTVTLVGNVPLGYMNTNLPVNSPGDDPRNYYPFFQSFLGTIVVSVMNEYIPGSIFYNGANISVFKSFAGTEVQVPRGHRNDQLQIAI